MIQYVNNEMKKIVLTAKNSILHQRTLTYFNQASLSYVLTSFHNIALLTCQCKLHFRYLTHVSFSLYIKIFQIHSYKDNSTV